MRRPSAVTESRSGIGGGVPTGVRHCAMADVEPSGGSDEPEPEAPPPRGRTISLVVVDSGGRVRGALPGRWSPIPWWPEVGEIVEDVPGATVLRLLSAEPDPDEPMGGSVTYLVESEAALDLEPWDGELGDHPLRAPWARPGGPAADLAWVRSVIEVTGPPQQRKTWNLSAIWRIPASDGWVWLKCVPPMYAHEGTILDHLGDEWGPGLIAADGHRLLLADLPGEDGFGASDAERITMLDRLVDLQNAIARRAEDLLAAGVPDLRADALTAAVGEIVERQEPPGGRRPELRALAEEAHDRFRALEELGPPLSIVHGDAHGGNCRVGTVPPVWFDWGDGGVGSPLLDLRCDWDKSEAVMAHWLGRWEDVAPRSSEAVRAFRPLVGLLMAHTYQRFCDSIEPSERIYHRDDVGAGLDLAAASYREET